MEEVHEVTSTGKGCTGCCHPVRVCAGSPCWTRDFLSTWIEFYALVKTVRRALSDVLNILIDHPKEIRKVGDEAHKLEARRLKFLP